MANYGGYRKGNEKGNKIMGVYKKRFPEIKLHMEQVGERNQGDQYDKHQVADGTRYVS